MAHDIVRCFVRGEAGEDALSEAGLRYSLVNGAFVESEPPTLSIVILAPDIAAGALKYHDNMEAGYRWSTIVSCAFFIDFDGDSEVGQFLVDILWDMMFRNSISHDRLMRLRDISANG